MQRRYYTGIGSTKTPAEVCDVMQGIASDLEAQGYVLRSGGAPGADSAFYLGTTDNSNCEIYLPWDGFNCYSSEDFILPEDLRHWREAEDIAARLHPYWGSIKKPGVKKLLTRDVFQVLGRNLNTSSDFVICWAKPIGNGYVEGGTNMAVSVALERHIPVINLYRGA